VIFGAFMLSTCCLMSPISLRRLILRRAGYEFYGSNQLMMQAEMGDELATGL
jgi:hypothetical protein